MREYRIVGGRRLCGVVPIHGAKNAVLPILAAASVCEDCRISGCPELTDVAVSCRILEHLGMETTLENGVLCTRRAGEGDPEIPDEWMRAMRSSIVFLGGVLARYHKASICCPGGCSLGPRPIDLHLSSLHSMGAVITEEGSHIRCEAPHGLHGAAIHLPIPSVGATETVLIAGAAACGETVLTGAAREPEITDLIRFLNTCGAKIEVEKDGTIRIEGQQSLHGGEHTVIPDRIAAATYLCAAAITGGEVTVLTDPSHLLAPLSMLQNAGCAVWQRGGVVTLRAPERLRSFGSVVTLPYPGFPTDLQAVFMALSCMGRGISTFTENIFESRFAHVEQLRRMGADITVMGRTAVVAGVSRLRGAKVTCTDLRGGAAVVLAALAAQGESTIQEISHIERGYEAFLPRLCRMGADIRWLGDANE